MGHITDLNPPSLPVTSKSFPAWLCTLVVALLCMTGCGGGEEDVDLNKPFTLTGADRVLAALQAKNYEEMVPALQNVRQTVTEADMPEYRRLRTKVTDQLVNEMADNEAAQNAYRAIGFMETGR